MSEIINRSWLNALRAFSFFTCCVLVLEPAGTVIEMVSALFKIIVFSSLAVRVGSADSNSAATPATCGAAIEVPDLVS